MDARAFSSSLLTPTPRGGRSSVRVVGLGMCKVFGHCLAAARAPFYMLVYVFACFFRASLCSPRSITKASQSHSRLVYSSSNRAEQNRTEQKRKEKSQPGPARASLFFDLKVNHVFNTEEIHLESPLEGGTWGVRARRELRVLTETR